jgi:hypothetical protein
MAELAGGQNATDDGTEDDTTPEPAAAVAAPEAPQAEATAAEQPEAPEPDGRTKIAQTIKDYLAERGDDGIAQLARCAKVSERTVEEFLAKPFMKLGVGTIKKIAKGFVILKQGDTIEREGMTVYFGD